MPSAPAFETAAASSATADMGAWTMGCSIPSSSQTGVRTSSSVANRLYRPCRPCHATSSARNLLNWIDAHPTAGRLGRLGRLGPDRLVRLRRDDVGRDRPSFHTSTSRRESGGAAGPRGRAVRHPPEPEGPGRVDRRSVGPVPRRPHGGVDPRGRPAGQRPGSRAHRGIDARCPRNRPILAHPSFGTTVPQGLAFARVGGKWVSM